MNGSFLNGSSFWKQCNHISSMQWSPTEDEVFASCSVDGSIAIWDIRLGKSPAISFKAHNADVNVISWNRCLNIYI